MSSISPASVLQADATTGAPTEQKSTAGSAHVTVTGSVGAGALVDVNTGFSADVDAAVAAAAGLRLMGFACKESAGTPAVASFNIVHGATGAAGTVVVPVKLALSTNQFGWFGPDGIACASGISIDWIAGTIDCELFYKVAA